MPKITPEETMHLSKSVMLRTLLTVVSCMMIGGCFSQKSFDDYAETRRQRLLEMYPLRKTSQKDVEARWGFPAQIKSLRPASGWIADPDSSVKTFAMGAEKRIGTKVAKAERYYGADGIFSLCYCWFYYDSSDRLIDAEWQWSSD
jgi:hypothetical protein